MQHSIAHVDSSRSNSRLLFLLRLAFAEHSSTAHCDLVTRRCYKTGTKNSSLVTDFPEALSWDLLQVWRIVPPTPPFPRPSARQKILLFVLEGGFAWLQAYFTSASDIMGLFSPCIRSAQFECSRWSGGLLAPLWRRWGEHGGNGGEYILEMGKGMAVTGEMLVFYDQGWCCYLIITFKSSTWRPQRPKLLLNVSTLFD